MRRYDTLLFASVVVTQDAERRILENAGVAVTNGRIAAVGPRADFRDAAATRTVELGNALLMPGLVNAHTHAAMTFLRGFADDLPLMDWLHHHIFPVEKHLTPEIVEWGALLGCAEMLRTGTTAFADMYLLEDATCAAVDKAGLKALVGEGLFSFPSPAYADARTAFALVREQAERYREHPRIRVAVMPHTVYTTTSELLERSRDLAEELNLTLHLHLAETVAETELCLSTSGKRPLRYCHDLGLLHPRTTFAHMVDVDAEELDILASSGAAVAHNPKSNMKLASGVAPVPAMLERGILPGIGTDGAAGNNALNLFSEMSACALLHKVHGDPTATPAQSVLDMATLGGAAALHWEGLGSIAPGGPADLVVLDLNAPNMQPLYSPVSQLVYAASGHEARLTMVDGEILYEDGRFTRMDYPALLEEIRKARQWVLDRKGTSL